MPAVGGRNDNHAVALLGLQFPRRVLIEEKVVARVLLRVGRAQIGQLDDLPRLRTAIPLRLRRHEVSKPLLRVRIVARDPHLCFRPSRPRICRWQTGVEHRHKAVDTLIGSCYLPDLVNGPIGKMHSPKQLGLW